MKKIFIVTLVFFNFSGLFAQNTYVTVDFYKNTKEPNRVNEFILDPKEYINLKAYDPITIGVLIAGLSSALSQLEHAIQSLGEEFRNAANSVHAQGMGLIDELNLVFKDRLDQTFDRLDASEKKMVNDANLLINQVGNIVNSIKLKESIFEADITSYNALYSLPLRSKVPRFVYMYNNDIRISNSDPPIMIIRGNYLNFDKKIVLSVGKYNAEIISRNDNEIQFKIPNELLKSNEVINVPVSCKLSTKKCGVLGCRLVDKRIIQTALTIRPARQIKINATIIPNADIVIEKKQFKWGFGCDDTHQRRLESYEIPVDWVLDDSYDNPEWNVYGGQGEAGLDVRRTKGIRTVEVGCWAKGKGWGPENRINGEIIAHAKKYTNNNLEPFAREEDKYDYEKSIYSFQYKNSTLPTDRFHLIWKYEVILEIKEGASIIHTSVSNDMPNISNQLGFKSITSTMNDGKLVISFND